MKMDKNLMSSALKLLLSEDPHQEKFVRDLLSGDDENTDLRTLAQRAGVRLRAVKLGAGWHKSDNGTLFGYWGENQRLSVFIPSSPKEYKIYNNDIPDGCVIGDAEAEQISPEAFLCYAGLPPHALKLWDLLRFQLERCWKSDFATIIFVSLAAGVLPLVAPLITEGLFSDIIPTMDRQSLGTVTQVMLVSGFAAVGFALVRSIAVMRVTSHIQMDMESAMWSRLLSLPVGFFRKYQAGELVGRMEGINALTSVFTSGFVDTIFSTLFSFWSLLLMMSYSVKLTMVACGVWVVYILLASITYKLILTYQRKMLPLSNRLSGLQLQIINGLPKFRLQAKEEQAFYLWAKEFKEEWKYDLKIRWQNNYNQILNAVQPLILTLFLYLSVSAEQLQILSYPQFLAFNAAFGGLNMAIVSTIPLIANFFGVIPHFENLKPILETPPEDIESKTSLSGLDGKIEISNLFFKYDENTPWVINDLSLSIESGQTVAIVGRSGSGKSTLMRLLLGFEKPKRGAIYFDGHDLNDLNLSSVRSLIGVVIQNSTLMEGSIFENIIGTMPLTMDDAWAAARKVGIDKDIEEMPMGMYTYISEGATNISGGQRQRILLARSLVGNPRIILLDEATSALDNVTQAIVARSLSEMSATKIFVAHRLSTVKNADKIVVIDGGEIVEQGTFDELIQNNGLFARLAKRQMA